MPDRDKSILDGGIVAYNMDASISYTQMFTLAKHYNIDLSKNYNDCGVMLYDLDSQKDVQAGGSGPVCSALVMYGDIIPKMKNKELKRVLYVATGALFNPVSVFQKNNILSIAHAVSLEVI